MRELEMGEVELVTGGYRAGQDGPSNDYSFWDVVSATANGAGAAGGLTAALGVQMGYTGTALSTGVIRGTGWGAAAGAGWGVGNWIGANVNSYNERVSGMSLGEALYRTIN